jgi:hypothetical protein
MPIGEETAMLLGISNPLTDKTGDQQAGDKQAGAKQPEKQREKQPPARPR